MSEHCSESDHRVAKAVEALTELLKHEFGWCKSHAGLATKTDLQEMEKIIMSKISDFATAQNAFNDQIDQAVTGLTGDIKTLNDLITTLQNSNGAITPEDQASLDALQARAKTIADKLTALDALTPPAVPAA